MGSSFFREGHTVGKSIKEYVFRKGAMEHVPVSGTFELTPRCNLNCKMCYIHMTEQEQCMAGKELSAAEWMETGRQAVNQGMVYLLLTGGEPLIRPDFCEIYTEMVKMGVVVSVNTNGTLINEKIIECFCRYRPETVNITLYGMSEETYGRLCGNPKGFERAVNGICMLKDAGIRVCLNTTFTRYNLQDMDAVIDFAKEKMIPVRMAAYLFPPVRNACTDTADKVYLSAGEQGRAGAYFDWKTLETEKMKKRQDYIKEIITKKEAREFEADELVCEASSCMAGKGAFWISWDGCMYPCGMLPCYSVSLKEAGFKDAWEETVELSKRILMPPECTDCNYKKVCPSCAAVSWSENQSTRCVSKELCERTKEYIKAFLNEEKKSGYRR